MSGFVRKQPLVSTVLFLLTLHEPTIPASAAPVGNCLTGATPFPIATECAQGFYCPYYNASDSSTVPVLCPPTLGCSIDRLASKFCDAQGTYEPILCEPGFVCPTPTEKIECPAGYHCPRGTFEPHPCPPLTSCAAGSEKPFSYASIVALAIADVTLFAMLTIYRKWHSQHVQQRNAHYAEAKVSSIKRGQFDPDAPDDELPAHIRLLCNGFRLAQRTLPPVQLTFNNLSLRIPATGTNSAKTILTGVTGSIQPGSVTAIMGPSGAGKTTFLNTLMDKIEPTWHKDGTLLINSEKRDLRGFRKVIGYVPQEDIMHRDLSVYENVKYSAATRLPRDWTEAQIEDHVNAVVLAVQLAHVQDTSIGDETSRGISGGQRKRVNIGMELAAAPSLLLLDEPTSGLDSTSAMDICHMLKDLARTCSLTVAMVIHQPRVEIWDSLDQLLLLAPGGRTVYQGPQKVAVKYFEQASGLQIKAHENPADALMDRIAEQADLLVTLWQQGGRERLQQLMEASLAVAVLSPAILQSSPDERVLANNATSISSLPSDTVIQVRPKGEVKIVLSNVEEQQTHSVERKSESMDSPVNSPMLLLFPEGLRLTASLLTQTKSAFLRAARKQVLNVSSLVVEIFVGMLAGIIMGVAGDGMYQGVLIAPYTPLSPAPLETIVPQLGMFISMGISLAAASAGVRVFGEEQVVYWREASSGHNRLSYFIGVTLAQIPRNFISGLHFAFIYHLIAQPLIPFDVFLPIAFLLFYCVYGVAALVSMMVARSNAALVSVVLALILSVFNGYVTNIPFFLKAISGAYWSTEAFFDQQTNLFRVVMQVTDISAPLWGYRLNWFSKDLALVFCIGTGYRILAFFAMIGLNRSKQR